MAYLIWLLFMGIIIGFLAVPIAQRVGYAYGRYGRTTDMLLVIVGTMFGGVLLAGLGGLLGFFAEGSMTGAIIGGIIGAIISVGLLVLLSTKAAEDEPNEREDIA